VRRAKRLNPKSKAGTGDGGQQQEPFSLYRYHDVFTDSPLILVQAEKTHRAHAIIEQVHADLKHGPLGHLPSASFQANSAWLVLAAIAFNLTRAAGRLASAFHARATTGTIRAQLINTPWQRPVARVRPHASDRQRPHGARAGADTNPYRDGRSFKSALVQRLPAVVGLRGAQGC